MGMVLFAKNTAHLIEFYRCVLDLSVSESEDSHAVLVDDGVELVIHAIPKKVADSIDLSVPPVERSVCAIKPVFWVKDLEVAGKMAEKLGGHLKPRESAWTIPGALVLDGCDPEGNVIQFKQSI